MISIQKLRSVGKGKVICGEQVSFLIYFMKLINIVQSAIHDIICSLIFIDTEIYQEIVAEGK